MPQNSIYLIFILAFIKINLSFSESIGNQLDSQLLQLEKLYFSTTSDSIKTIIAIKKQNLYIQNNFFGKEGLNEVKRINFRFLDSTNKRKVYFNSSLLSYLTKDYNLAYEYFQESKLYINQLDTSQVLFELLIYLQFDSTNKQEHINWITVKYPNLKGIESLNDAEKFSLKHKGLITASSAILPGSGTIMNGKIFRGATSMVFNATTVIAISALLKNSLYFNSIGYALTFGVKFYTGNLKLTNKTFNEKELMIKNKLSKNAELRLNDIQKKYPIDFVE